MKAILKIAWREWRMILADSRLRSVALVAPFAYAILMAAVYSHNQVDHVSLAVLNQDQGSLGQRLLSMVEASPKLDIRLTAYSMAEIEQGLRNKTILGAVVIPKDFSQRLKSGHDSKVIAFVNAADMVNANTLASNINRVVQTMSSGIEIRGLMKRGLAKDRAIEMAMPIKLDLRSMFNPSYNYTNFMIPGILMTILQQVILMAIALSLTGEKEFRTLPQLFALSTKPYQLLIGKGLIYVLINFIVLEFYLRVLFPIHEIPIAGSWYLTLGFSTLFVLVVVTWGLWVSTLCQTRLFATQLLMFLAMPSFVLSGFTWPLAAMPEWIQVVSNLLPMTHFVSSFRQIYLAGSEISDIWPSILALIGFLGINIILFRIAIHRLVKAHKVDDTQADQILARGSNYSLSDP